MSSIGKLYSLHLLRLNKLDDDDDDDNRASKTGIS